MQAQPPSRRILLSALVFVFCCLLSSARLVWDAQRPATDLVTARSDQRFAALKAALPDHGTIGYVGESDPAALGNYYLAQYALAPLVVEHSANHALVVGNFLRGSPAQPPGENLQLVRDFGDGVLLLANKDSR